jgi:2'-5' RNA ligase
MNRRRVFFALWPDEAAVEHMSALAVELAGRSARIIPSQSLHLTLAFVGAVTDAQIAQLEDVAGGIEESIFDFSIDRLGFWPQRGILWAGCRQPVRELSALMTDMRVNLAAAGFCIDAAETPLVPHVTLARGVRCAALPRLASSIGFQTREFALVESHRSARGSRYETLASFPLGTAD